MDFEEKLIQAVRNRPCLYTRAYPNYKNTDEVINAWEKVAVICDEPVNSCKQRWKSLRDRYVRESKSQIANSGWEYMDDMSFLKDYILKTKPRKKKVVGLGNGSSRGYTQITNWSPDETSQMVELQSPLEELNDDEELSLANGCISSRTYKSNVPIKPKSNEGYSQTPQRIIFKPVAEQSNNNYNSTGPPSNPDLMSKTTKLIQNNICDLHKMIGNLIETKRQKTHSSHEPFLKILENYVNKVDVERQEEFKLSILNIAFKELEKYKNK